MNRLTTGLLIAFAWLGILASQSFLFLWLVCASIAGLALHEYYAICLEGKEKRLLPLALVVSAIPLFAALAKQPDLLFASFFVTLFASALLLFATYQGLENGFILLAKLCCGIAYISLGAAHLPLLRALTHGGAWLAILTVITIASDTGAYYAGSALGKTKLCPAISPKKTVEGLLGGMGASLILALCLGRILLPQVSLVEMAVMICTVTLIGVGGDLLESVIKRSCRVKDSGTMLPGHGGVLDRIDSLLTAAPAMYYIIYFRVIG